MVHKIKTNENGDIEKYKARHVAKRFKLIESLQCFYTFAPRSKPKSLRFLLSLSATKYLVPRQTDVKSAYLHLKLKKRFIYRNLKVLRNGSERTKTSL